LAESGKLRKFRWDIKNMCAVLIILAIDFVVSGIFKKIVHVTIHLGNHNTIIFILYACTVLFVTLCSAGHIEEHLENLKPKREVMVCKK
ncbi:hypothetical protein PENTCL1PPCAC_3427, partial [Pristionchus entomophagus]